MFSSGELALAAGTATTPTSPARPPANSTGVSVSATTEQLTPLQFLTYAAGSEASNIVSNVLNYQYSQDLLEKQQAAIEQVFEWRNNMVNAQRELGRLA